MKLRPRALRVIAIGALALSSVLAGFCSALAQARASASAGAPSPIDQLRLAQTPRTQAGPSGPELSPDRSIGLPRVREYETIPELRDVYFDFGTATIRPGNVDLGEQRAEAAMKYLVEQGIHPSRIFTLSYGAERPQCTEESERCWSQNRRSRFLVKPR